MGVVLAAMLTVSLDAPVLAADAIAPPPGRIGEIVIGLPETGGAVSFAFGAGRVTVEVPRGAAFPLDIIADAGGIARSADVREVDPERTRLELRLASGFLAAVDINSKSVVLKLSSGYVGETAVPEEAGRYLLGPQDRIQIVISGHPELTQQVVVGGDGRAAVPLIGDVAVGGQSVRDATARITEALARDYLVDPKVDLQVLDYRSQWVMVTGEIAKPGRIPLRGQNTLKDVLADADGMGPNAGDEILISRRGAAGREEARIPVDRGAFERSEVNPTLQTGDIVNVAARPSVYVQGEVRNPGRVSLERGMTLMKAIAIAGGLSEWASEKHVQILSEGAQTEPRTYDLRDILKLKTADPPLKGGDVVIVKKRFL
jgi:polysaccharide export outer membrane protein